MLIQIDIRDVATIEALHLNFKTGTTMITGETGAGKSIFIEAIEMALGARASQTIVRPGKDKAEISLSFDISNFPTVIARLKELDLYQDAAECIIRRIITHDGRSRCYVNGSPSQLHLAKELGVLLFHLHGQHEQQVLLEMETQRDMLDRYADHSPLVASVKEHAHTFRALELEAQALRAKCAEREGRCEYLRFQLNELDAIDLKTGEWEQLEIEQKRLAHSEELVNHLQQAAGLLSEADNQTILSLLNDVRKLLDALSAIEPAAATWIETLHSASIMLGDLADEWQRYLQRADLDPEKLAQLEERMGHIFTLSRKHKVQPQDLIILKAQLLAEFNTLESSDDALARLEQQKETIRAAYHQAASELSRSRMQAAKRFEKEITATIRSLSLPHGEFTIELQKEPTVLSPHGMEKIVFLIRINPDQTAQPLAKVISGGELSRLSLAAHLALASKTNIPTLVFDEVDTGLSGATAEKIGKLLRTLGESYQVFCITHQPQVAACGHHHLLVEKCFIEKSTHTRLRLLETKEKTAEIARMLGGEKITDKTLAHAKEVLQRA